MSAAGEFVRRCGWLLIAAALAYALVGPALWAWHGGPAWMAAAIGGAICLGGSIASLAAVSLLPANAGLARLLVGMGLRMTLPLAAGFFALTQWKSLADAGLAVSLVVFYLVMLAVETRFVVRDIAAFKISAGNAS